MGAAASLLTAPLRAVLLAVSALVPRDRRLWAFGSSYGRRFADNPKWLFLHCVRNQERLGVRPVWVTGSQRVRDSLSEQGFEVRRWAWWNLRALWTTMRAGVWIYDSDLWDIGYPTSPRARKVNLWHGIPLKRVKLAIGNARHPDRVARSAAWPRRLLERILRPGAGTVHDVVPATSPECRDRFAQTFDLPAARIPILGFARNDALAAGQPPETMADAAVHKELADHRANGGLVVFYMPTFRDSRPAGEGHRVDWPRLDRFGADLGVLVAVKLHPRDQAAPIDVQPFEHLRFLPADADPYILLRSADALVTDYSSVFYDFLLVDRPVFFFPYDLEDYTSRDRPLHEAYDQATPGPKARTTRELVGRLTAWVTDPDAYDATWGAPRRAARDRFHTHQDASASERVAEHLRARFC